MSKHQYYYHPTGGKPGRKPSKHTLQKVGDQVLEVPNSEVVDYMRQVLANPLADYGYHRMSGELTLSGFFINHKKVYRLMKTARLLQGPVNRESKQYVRYRIICPEGPLRLMEMDIKVVWVEGLRRYAFVLTILDVFTRAVLYWKAGFHMRQGEVQEAWKQVISRYMEPHEVLAWDVHIEIRSDNGPQFCARKLREFLKENCFVQTFTHPYTPQENGHIESFHAILSRALEGQYFEDLIALCAYLENFYQFYNYERIHGSTVKLPPMTFWRQWKQGNIERKVLDEKGRKVRFLLRKPRQEIKKIQAADNGSQREVSSLDLVGVDPPSNPKKMQSDGPVLNAQPAA